MTSLASSVAAGTRTCEAKVLIVDDHDLLCQALAFAFTAVDLTVERCRDITEDGILRCIGAYAPDLVLLDLDIGGELGTSLPLIPRITAGGTTVMMLTGVADQVRLGACIEAGAAAVIAKSAPFDRLVAAVHATAAGRSILADERAEYLAALRRHREEERRRLRIFEQLTPRETQVLDALTDGNSAEQIAEQWVVSITTVRSQIRALLRKLGVNSQLSAVALARQTGWRQNPQS